MTIKDAIDILEDNHTVLYSHGDYTEQEENEALSMAIEALEQRERNNEEFRRKIKEMFPDTFGTIKESVREEISMRKVVMYCDRCKKEFEKWDNEHREIIGVGEMIYDDGEPYLDCPKDLCESCYTELEKWWNFKPQESEDKE